MGGCQVGIAYRESFQNWFLLVSLSFWTFAYHNTVLKIPDTRLPLPGGSQKSWGFNFCTHFSQKMNLLLPQRFLFENMTFRSRHTTVCLSTMKLLLLLLHLLPTHTLGNDLIPKMIEPIHTMLVNKFHCHHPQITKHHN